MTTESKARSLKPRQLTIVGGDDTVTASFSQNGVTAQSSRGLTVELSETTAFDQVPLPFDREKVLSEKLASGITVHTNGQLVGHLTQHHHGWRRTSRVLELAGVDPHHFPPGLHLRQRGLSGYTSLETPDQRLASCQRTGLRLRTQLRVKDASEESVMILSAVHSGLAWPLKRQSWFRFGIGCLFYILMFLGMVGSAINALADWF